MAFARTKVYRFQVKVRQSQFVSIQSQQVSVQSQEEVVEAEGLSHLSQLSQIIFGWGEK